MSLTPLLTQKMMCFCHKKVKICFEIEKSIFQHNKKFKKRADTGKKNV